MIFVCVGSREYQFNRLLKKLDELAAQGKLEDEVFAQIGQSEYEPKHFPWVRYMDREDFQKHRVEADLIISHAGTGALIGAIKLEKQVIAVPRLAKYQEHIDDHQTQIADVLSSEGYLRQILDMEDLEQTIRLAKTAPITKRYERPSNVIQLIEDFLG